jgi:hypothetical protein
LATKSPPDKRRIENIENIDGNSSKILILFRNWKAWLRSQAFNTCRDGALARREGRKKSEKSGQSISIVDNLPE